MAKFLFEDRSTYDPAVGAVAHITLSVQCHPKQVDSVMTFLGGVRDKAGVYYGEWDYEVIEPAAAPVAGPELEQSDTVSPPSLVAAVDAPAEQAPEAAPESVAPTDEASAEAPAGNPDEQIGAPDGEQLLQQADRDDQATDLGEGRATEEIESAAGQSEHADAELAGAAGELGAGSVARDA